MRLPFANLERIKRLVRENEFDTLLEVLEDHWSNKYKLPPNHPLFLDRSVGAHLTEYFRDYKNRKEELQAQVDILSQPEERTKTIEAIAEIDRMLGYVEDLAGSGDPLADLWEKQFQMGEEPDLEMSVDDLK